MKLAKGTVRAPASAVANVTGDPSRKQTVVLKQGAKAPSRGRALVVDATSSGPGVLGKVVASKRLHDGRTQLSLKPATLDQAYSQFNLRFDGSMAALAGSSLVLADGPEASGSAHTSASKLTAFSCKGPQVKKPDIEVDLTPLRVSSDIAIEYRQVFFLITGRPVIKLGFELKGGASCRLSQNLKVFIPIAGPVGIDLSPVLEFSAGADSELDFRMEPQIAVGFARGNHTNADYRVLNPRHPSLGIHGSFGVDAFAGGSIGVSVGGRAGVRGKFGPVLGLKSTAAPGQLCGDVSGALRMRLEAYANVFIADLTFQIAQGDFLRKTLFSECIGTWEDPGGQNGGGGGSEGSSSDDSGQSDIEIFRLPPGSDIDPNAIAAGADGNLWFTGFLASGHVGRITTSGTISEYPLPNPVSHADEITPGINGNMWYVDGQRGLLGEISPTGAVVEHPVPGLQGTFTGPRDVTAGPDGNMWFTTGDSSRIICKMTPTGAVTQYRGLSNWWSGAGDTMVGPDGRVWFANYNVIARTTTSGELSDYPLEEEEVAFLLAKGPQGDMWTSILDNAQTPPVTSIAKVTLGGDITRYPLEPGESVGGLTGGPDGNVWFTLPFSNEVGRITPQGAITRYQVPNIGVGTVFQGITAGPDGGIWFTLNSAIGRIDT